MIYPFLVVGTRLLNHLQSYFTIFSKASLAAICSARFLEKPFPLPNVISSNITATSNSGLLLGPDT